MDDATAKRIIRGLRKQNRIMRQTLENIVERIDVVRQGDAFCQALHDRANEALEKISPFKNRKP